MMKHKSAGSFRDALQWWSPSLWPRNGGVCWCSDSMSFMFDCLQCFFGEIIGMILFRKNHFNLEMTPPVTIIFDFFTFFCSDQFSFKKETSWVTCLFFSVSSTSPPADRFSDAVSGFSSNSGSGFLDFAYFLARKTFMTSGSSKRNVKRAELIILNRRKCKNLQKAKMEKRQHTLSCNKPIGMAKSKSIIWPEKLDTSKTHRLRLPIVFLRLRQGNYKRNIVTRISPHNLTGHHRPIQPLNPATWVLYNKSRRINRLAIPHLNCVW